jgi:hypothetical protein
MEWTDGFRFPAVKDVSLYSTASRPTLGLTQPPIQRVTEAHSSGVKRQGREANRSPPATVEVKNGGDIPQLPHTSSWRDA